MSLIGIIYLVNAVGPRYAKVRTDDGKRYIIYPKQKPSGRIPEKDDRIRLEPSPIGSANPDSLKVLWWEFVDAPTESSVDEQEISASDISKKAEENFGVQAMLLTLKKHLAPEQFAAFYNTTPNGSRLWGFFKRKKHESESTEYNYFSFANDVLGITTP